MEKTIISQLLEAAGALGAGAVLGIIYDFLRCLRREFSSTVLAAVCDTAFAFAAAALLFTYGIASPSGGLTLYIASLSFAGAVLYFAAAGKYVRRVFAPLFRILRKILAFAANLWAKVAGMLKKIKENIKNIFSRAKKRFTIIGKSVSCENPVEKRKGRRREIQENRLSNESSYRGPDYLRCD